MKCFEATITNKDVASVSKLLQSGDIAFGSNVTTFENRFSEYSNKKYNIGLNSASSAAYCLFAYLYDKHGSCDVYTPSIGFTSPAWAAIKNGHKVYFLDIDKNLLVNYDSYWNIRKDRDSFNKSVFMPILYGGVSNIDGLIEQVRDTNLGDIIVVDSAHCIEPTIESDYIFFSFHPVKPLTMGTGGLLATDDDEADEYIKRYRNFGRNNIDDSYDIVDNGFKFYMDNLNARLGLSQFDTCFDNIKIRKNNLGYLKNNIKLNIGYFTEHDEQSSYYLGTLILNDRNSKNLRKKLKDNECSADFAYPFLHKTTFFSTGISLKNTENMEDRIINLPIHQNLTKNDLDKIIRTING
jgi:UDP-4-amino-4,6-dideoxy-L-N-acetyl-beta-L-altrosamine transaminase